MVIFYVICIKEEEREKMENKTLINAIEGELREVRISLNAAERYIEQLRSQLNVKAGTNK